MNFDAFQHDSIIRVERFLTQLFSSYSLHDNRDTCLVEAMQYSVFNGGKRVRPLLVYATGNALGYSSDRLDAPAAAIELIHCYSLIHDDLPDMDNDDLRRGKPTCHKAYDVATAILAGDALQALAFQILADPHLNPVPAVHSIEMIRQLAAKSGMQGMVGGQALDLNFSNHQVISIEQLKTLHQKKTGALIEACVTLGALASEEKPDPTDLLKLQEYAKCIGLAFQIQDDILDVIGDSTTLGKTAGKDKKQNKDTFPEKMGLDKAKEYAHSLYEQALETIGFLKDKRHHLAKIAELFVMRLS